MSTRPTQTSDLRRALEAFRALFPDEETEHERRAALARAERDERTVPVDEYFSRRLGGEWPEDE